MKKLLLICLVFFSTLFSGCVAISQTSKNVKENGNRYYFALSTRAITAYNIDGNVILKCPLVPYQKKHSLIKIKTFNEEFEETYYQEVPTQKTEYAFVKVNELKVDKTVYFPSNNKIISFENYVPEPSKICAENEIPIPKEVKTFLAVKFPIGDQMLNGENSIMTFVKKEPSEFLGTWYACAVVNGVVIDVPLSVLMTAGVWLMDVQGDDKPVSSGQSIVDLSASAILNALRFWQYQ